MKLRSVIDHYFGGNQTTFREAVGVSAKTIYRWLTAGAVVNQGMICLPLRELPPLPVVAPDMRREDFEKRLARHYPELDKSSVDGIYIDTQVQKLWDGWCMAQAVFTRDALDRSAG
ncbi:hypothetical protein IFY47_003397 [Salmonella enterica]|nr:hypothetical protein [Salmonella enterica]